MYQINDRSRSDRESDIVRNLQDLNERLPPRLPKQPHQQQEKDVQFNSVNIPPQTKV